MVLFQCNSNHASIAIKYVSAITILGGFTDVYSSNSKTHYGRIYEWGIHQSGLKGTYVWLIALNYCYNPFTNSQGYCRLRLVTATDNNDRDYHYDILGTRQVLMDNSRQNEMGERHQFGEQVIGDGETDIIVASGYSWGETNGYGPDRYSYLYFIIKRSSGPPQTYAFSRRAARVRTDPSDAPYNDHVPAGFSPSDVDGLNRFTIGEFKCWSSTWYQRIYYYCNLYLWRMQTQLISYSLRYDDMEILKSTNKVPKVRPLILENHASGQTTVDFPRLNYSEDVTTSSTARFIDTFDFAIDNITRPIEFDVFGSSSPAAVSSHFVFSDASDLQDSVENTVSVSISWPSKCDPGFRVTYSVDSYSEMQRIPVDFEFERGDESWKEAKNVEVNLEWIEINVHDCCLYEYANKTCGTEHLPMC